MHRPHALHHSLLGPLHRQSVKGRAELLVGEGSRIKEGVDALVGKGLGATEAVWACNKEEGVIQSINPHDGHKYGMA